MKQRINLDRIQEIAAQISAGLFGVGIIAGGIFRAVTVCGVFLSAACLLLFVSVVIMFFDALKNW